MKTSFPSNMLSIDFIIKLSVKTEQATSPYVETPIYDLRNGSLKIKTTAYFTRLLTSS